MRRRHRYLLYCLLSLFAFALIALAVEFAPAVRAFDASAVAALAAARTYPGVSLMLFFTELGSAVPVTLIVAAIGIVLLARKREAPLTAFSITLLGALSSYLVAKDVFALARPDVFFRAIAVTGYTFPSGHATMAAALYGSLALSLSHALEIARGAEHTRALRVCIAVACALVALMIGISRVYLGVHFPSDVIAGFALGLAWLYFGNYAALHHPHLKRLNA
ncbi:MAG: phosphatase PAP2 family protein [Patescibacteria group bacterium]|nr:phosphatase PAP2 family protein [Patescibacteria group bacterium]MDE1966089.1 phosphatase PAP2 family protein [Patescibacteria group bacterium]